MKEGLKHPEAEERRRTLAALNPQEVSLALSDLYALLDDSDWRVRREVALALARMKDPDPAIEPLVDAVTTGDVARRNAAMEALRNIGAVAAPSVLSRFEKTTGSARRFLIEVLADVGSEACVGPLAIALEDSDPNIPPAAAEALGRIPAASARDALLGALSHKDPVVRLAVLQAFATRDEVLNWSVIEPLLSDPICRRAALRAASSCNDPRALTAIAAAFADANAALSSEAAIACSLAARRGQRERVRAALLARSGSARVLRHLADGGATFEVRRAAIDCLGLIAEPHSVVSVLRGTESPETTSAADEALERFGSDAVPFALAAASGLGANGTASLLRWALQRANPEDHTDLVALAWSAIHAGNTGVAAWDVVAAVGTLEDAQKLVGRMENPSAVVDPSEHSRPLVTLLARFPELAQKLSDVAPLSTRIGLLIAEIVASAGHPVPIESLCEALTAPDSGVRAAAARALGAVGNHKAARDALEFALADEDPTVQAVAAEALGALGAGTEVLEQSLRASEPRVRRAAAKALARRGGAVRSLLVQALDDPDAAVVLAALEGIGAEATVEDLEGLTTHRDADVAAESLVRLRALDAHRGAKAALRMLDHPVWSVRLEAVRSLDVRGPETADAIKRLSEVERDQLVREAIDTVRAKIVGSIDGGGRPA